MSKKIATEAYAKNIGGGSAAAVADKCCTKSRAEAFGCTVASGYGSLQLVPESALRGSTPTKTLLAFYVDQVGRGTLYVNDNVRSGSGSNIDKIDRLSIAGVRNSYPEGTVWTKDISGMLSNFVPFSNHPISFTANVDMQPVTVSFESGYKLTDLANLRDSAEYDRDPELTIDFIGCAAFLKSQWESEYAVATGYN